MKNIILALAAVVLLAFAGEASAQRGCRGSCINGGFGNVGFAHGGFIAPTPVFVPQTFGFFGANQFNGFANPFINHGFGVNQFAFNNGFGFNPFFNNGFAFANRNFAFQVGGGFNPFVFNNGFAFRGNGFNRGFRRGCR